jgi:hypothetical protein
MKIQDNLIKPYSICLTSSNYDVLEHTNKLDKKGNEIIKSHGHYSSVESALNKVTKLIVEQDKVFTVSEYVKELKATRIKLN